MASSARERRTETGHGAALRPALGAARCWGARWSCLRWAAREHAVAVARERPMTFA